MNKCHQCGETVDIQEVQYIAKLVFEDTKIGDFVILCRYCAVESVLGNYFHGIK